MRKPQVYASRKIMRLLALLLCVGAAAASRVCSTTTKEGDRSTWLDSSTWTHGVPSDVSAVVVADSSATIATVEARAHRLHIDRASVRIQGSLRVGSTTSTPMSSGSWDVASAEQWRAATRDPDNPEVRICDASSVKVTGAVRLHDEPPHTAVTAATHDQQTAWSTASWSLGEPSGLLAAAVRGQASVSVDTQAAAQTLRIQGGHGAAVTVTATAGGSLRLGNDGNTPCRSQSGACTRQEGCTVAGDDCVASPGNAQWQECLQAMDGWFTDGEGIVRRCTPLSACPDYTAPWIVEISSGQGCLASHHPGPLMGQRMELEREVAPSQQLHECLSRHLPTPPTTEMCNCTSASFSTGQVLCNAGTGCQHHSCNWTAADAEMCLHGAVPAFTGELLSTQWCGLASSFGVRTRLIGGGCACPCLATCWLCRRQAPHWLRGDQLPYDY